MIAIPANRLLTLAETAETARRYHVGITSVSRRCMVSGFAGVNWAHGGFATRRAEAAVRPGLFKAGRSILTKNKGGSLQ